MSTAGSEASLETSPPGEEGDEGRAQEASRELPEVDVPFAEINRDRIRVKAAVASVETWLASEDELVCLVQSLARRVDEVYELQKMQDSRIELRNLEVHELYSKLAQQRADSQSQARRLVEVKTAVDSHHELLVERQCLVERSLSDNAVRQNQELEALRQRREQSVSRDLEERLAALESHLERELNDSAARHSQELEALKAERASRRSDAVSRELEDRLTSLERQAAQAAKAALPPPGQLGYEERLQLWEERLGVLDSSVEQLATDMRGRLDILTKSFEELQSHTENIRARSLDLARRCGSISGELQEVSKFKTRVEEALEGSEEGSPLGRRNKSRSESQDRRVVHLAGRVDCVERELRTLANLNDQGFATMRGSMDQFHERLLEEKQEREGHGALIQDLRKSHASLDGKATALLESYEATGRRLCNLENSLEAAEHMPAPSESSIARVSIVEPASEFLQEAQSIVNSPVSPMDAHLPPRRVVKPSSSMLSPHLGLQHHPDPEPVPTSRSDGGLQHHSEPLLTHHDVLQHHTSPAQLKKAPHLSLPLEGPSLGLEPARMQPRQHATPVRWLSAPMGASPDFTGPALVAAPHRSTTSTPPFPQGPMALPMPPPLPAPPVLPTGALSPAGTLKAGLIGAPMGPPLTMLGPAPKASGPCDLFSLIDANHDGVITRAELQQAFTGGPP